MRHVEIGYTTEDLNTAIDKVYRRVVALENDTNTTLRTTAPTAPIGGDMWLDISAGQIKIYNGQTWDSYQKV